MTKSLAEFIDLPVVSDPRGNLCFAESERHVPFEIQRVYYLYDVPSGSSPPSAGGRWRSRSRGWPSSGWSTG
ncbi:WxcM-like domain-containing protein [Phenylobacterium sp.]|jgi:hypothetical protein|uniref:WxcM-like domain-containing protein n=1 Tax=Phenylobacterium sp. TaxID=1871053 RepID=UPI002F947A17